MVRFNFFNKKVFRFGIRFVFFFGLATFVTFAIDKRVCAVEFVVAPPKSFQLSRSSLIPDEHFAFRMLSMNSTLGHSIFGFISFYCYYVFIIFGSAGFSFFGAEMMKKYLFQPQLPKPEEHVLAKTVLQEVSGKIIKKGRMVYSINDDLKENRHKMTLVEAKTKTRIMDKKIREIEVESEELKEMLEIFERESNFENENPLMNLGFGVLGIFTYIMGFFFLINNYYLINYYFHFTDNAYYILRTYIGMGAVYCLMLISYSLILMSVFKGYQKISELVPDSLIAKFSLIEDKTWTDNFLGISNFLSIATLSTIMALLRQFPTVYANSGLYYLFYLNYSSVYPYSDFINLYYPNVFFIIFFMVGFFVVFFEPAPKEKLWKLVEERKEDLKEKQEVIKGNPDLI